MDASVGMRRLRIAMVTATLLVLTVGGHSAADGTGPSLVGMLVVGGLAYALTTVVAARPLSLPRLAAYLLAAQALFHAVLSVASAHGAHPGGSPAVSTGAMVAAHACAAVVASVVLVRADDLVQRWHRFVATLLGVLRQPPEAPRGPSARRRAAGPDAVWPQEMLLHVVSRRGPPSASQPA